MKKRFATERREMKVIKDALARPTNRMRGKVRYAYVDQIDFDYEIGEAAGGSTVYASPADLIANQGCAVECGIYRVKIIMEKVVWPQKFTKESFEFPTEAQLAHAVERLEKWKNRVVSAKNRVKYLKQELKKAKANVRKN